MCVWRGVCSGGGVGGGVGRDMLVCIEFLMLLQTVREFNDLQYLSSTLEVCIGSSLCG